MVLLSVELVTTGDGVHSEYKGVRSRSLSVEIVIIMIAINIFTRRVVTVIENVDISLCERGLACSGDTVLCIAKTFSLYKNGLFLFPLSQ